MKIYFKIPQGLKIEVNKELQLAYHAFEKGERTISWRHLERAHILGQSYPIEHTIVHWQMIRFGFKIKNAREITGQIPRLFFGGIKSFIGKIPLGNTGGSDVPSLKPMEIPNDLLLILKKYN